MQGAIWDPGNLKKPLAEGDIQIVEWKTAPEGAARERAVFLTKSLPDGDLTQHKERTLYLTLQDGRQAKVQVQYASTTPDGLTSTLKVVSGWDEVLVERARA